MLIDASGIWPMSFARGEMGQKVGAVIVPAAKDSKELEGVCHSAGYVFPSLAQSCPSVLLAKEQLSSQRCDGYRHIRD